MTPASALLFYNGMLQSGFGGGHEPTERAATFLRDYCLFYLSKHLPQMIRLNNVQLANLPPRAKEMIIDHSFEYLVDDRSDLDDIVKFMSD